MEHFYGTDEMSTNNEVDSQNCKYNDESTFSGVIALQANVVEFVIWIYVVMVLQIVPQKQ